MIDSFQIFAVRWRPALQSAMFIIENLNQFVLFFPRWGNGFPISG